ncbi:hypothetical protein DZC31_25065 [Stenotrophomonas rhizophila]|nr:hypothetical protein DZC31_25065 [Stenotrophomonas rhizophila]
MRRCITGWGEVLSGAALQPFRDTRPLLQGHAVSCRSGLVSRKGRKAAPATPTQNMAEDSRRR